LLGNFAEIQKKAAKIFPISLSLQTAILGFLPFKFQSPSQAEVVQVSCLELRWSKTALAVGLPGH